MNKHNKYKLLKHDTAEVNNVILYRIEALKSFGDIKKYDKGGFIQNESNLSHDGDSWVYESAKVLNNATVSENAKICDCAIVYDNAKISNEARVLNHTIVSGDVVIDSAVNLLSNAIPFGSFIITHRADIKAK